MKNVSEILILEIKLAEYKNKRDKIDNDIQRTIEELERLNFADGKSYYNGKSTSNY